MKPRRPPLSLLGKRAFGADARHGRRARHGVFERAFMLPVSPAARRQLRFGLVRRRGRNRDYTDRDEQHVYKQVAHFPQLYSRLAC